MKNKEKIFLLTIGGVITTLVVYVTVRLSTSDAAFSIVPGWHTTIYPPAITWAILTALILVTALIVYLIFKLTLRLLTFLWTRGKQ
jgi:hypothetical protein